MFNSLVLLASGAAAAALDSQQYEVKTAHTTSGRIKGHIAAWPENHHVSEYLGIPYAEPPLGKHRWAPPRKFRSNETFLGNKYINDCLQPGAEAGKAQFANVSPDDGVTAYGLAMGGGTDHFYSEDCLALNVWTKPQAGENKKAVFVWIHGGAFGAGTSNAPYMNGARLASEHDLVVVSINYRLNVFGFPDAPFLAENNLGLLDQRLAIEWIRDNIHHFGGDPKRITISGDSAGGASVDHYSYAWKSDPIVAGFVPMSGVANAVPMASIEKTNWYALSEKLGCGGRPAAEQTIECLRPIPGRAIMKALESMSKGGAAAAMMKFGPVPDGKTAFADISTRGYEGNFIRRPMLVGNTDHEMGLVSGMLEGTLKGSIQKGGAVGLLATMGQAGINYVSSSPLSLSLLKYMDTTFSCPSGDAAAYRRKHDVPAWRYRYMGEWPNTNWLAGMGAYHSSDTPIVFGTTELKPRAAKNTPDEDRLIKHVMSAVAAFTKDPERGLTKLGYPLYEATGKTLIRWGYQNKSELNFGGSTEYDAPCKLIKIIKDPKSPESMEELNKALEGLAGLMQQLGGPKGAPKGASKGA